MYSQEDYFHAYRCFEEKYDNLGMSDFDYFYIYSDLRWFASQMGKNLTKNQFCSAVIKPLIEKNKTVIIPTYTYTVKGVFEVLELSLIHISAPTSLRGIADAGVGV